MPKYDYVDIYFDRFGSALLIPLAYTEIGITAQLDHPLILQSPLEPAELGKFLREALAFAHANPFLSQNDSVDVWSKASGIKDWKTFVQERQMLDVFINDNDEYNIRYNDNSSKEGYSSLYLDPELDIQVSSNISDDELGKAILSILNKGIARFEPDFFVNKDTDSEVAMGKVEVENKLQDGPLPFGYKMSWLVLKSDAPDEVLKALGCTSKTPTSWKAGIEEADISGERTFLSEPIDDYVLAIGVGDLSLEELGKLAEVFEDVQYYLSHRVIDYQAWAHFKNGTLIRAYKFLGESGEVDWDEGVQSDFEKELGLVALPTKDGDWPDKTTFPGEEQVIDIAAHFSVDPLFRDSSYPKQSGYLCTR